MILADKILENERNQKFDENKALVLKRLKELVYAFPNETLQVLRKTGIPVNGLLPSPVLFAVVVKNLDKNSQFREAIANMLLEADTYANANGQGWQVVGGVVSALGSVLSGIGRGQTQQTTTDSDKQAQIIQQQLDAERAKRTRNTWIIIGISVVTITAVIIGIKAYYNNVTAQKAAIKNPAIKTVPQIQHP